VAKDINKNTYQSCHQCSDKGKMTRPREECDLSVSHTKLHYTLHSVVICRCNKLTEDNTLEKWRVFDGE
jgi:hypothetical protein